MTGALRRLALTVVLMTGLTWAQPPDGAADVLPDLRQIGSGEMRWFGFKLYDATLWASGGTYVPTGGFALSLRYARSFDGVRLAKASIDEIRRLGERDDARLSRWKDLLSRVFPDVKEGDVITGVKMPDGTAHFFHQGRALAAIEDRALSEAFFAIWLDRRTREPALRARLLATPSG